MKKFKAIFSIFIGASMLGLWCFLLATNNVAEIKTEPISIVFHLSAELLTAALLLTGGICVLTNKLWAEKIFMLSMGALIYTAINSAGFYGQNNDIGMVVMFAVILFFALFFSISSLGKDLKRQTAKT